MNRKSFNFLKLPRCIQPVSLLELDLLPPRPSGHCPAYPHRQLTLGSEVQGLVGVCNFYSGAEREVATVLQEGVMLLAIPFPHLSLWCLPGSRGSWVRNVLAINEFGNPRALQQIIKPRNGYSRWSAVENHWCSPFLQPLYPCLASHLLDFSSVIEARHHMY